MDLSARQTHWDTIYSTKAPDAVSWYEAIPQVSLELIRATGLALDAPIIDVGGGASRLVDALLEVGYSDLTVLDVSAAALEASRLRLGEHSERVERVVADITNWQPDRRYNCWHDRAVFHFLTDAEDRQRYVDCLTRALSTDGHAIIATFALDGPEQCSGLPVVRYDAATLATTLGDAFELVEYRAIEHITPWGAVQRFQVSHLRRR